MIVIPQMPMKWEHKADNEKTWTEYSLKHSQQLSQANIAVCPAVFALNIEYLLH